jgi:hypothetical protein
MKNYIQGFRTEITNSVFEVSAKTWLRITGVYAINMIVLFLFVALGVLFFLKEGFNFPMGGYQDPENMLQLYRELFDMVVRLPGFILYIIVVFFIILLVSAWAYTLGFIIVDDYARGGRKRFSEQFNQSFTSKVFLFLGAALVIYLILLVGIFIAISLATISGFLAFLGILAVFIFINKLILVLPALMVGNQDFGEAFAFSVRNINLARTFKLFGVEILFFLALLVAGVVIMLLSMAFMAIPVAGQLIQMLIQIALGGMIMALFITALVGLYHRYAQTDPESIGSGSESDE